MWKTGNDHFDVLRGWRLIFESVFKKMNVIKDGDNFAVVESLTKHLVGQGVTISEDATRA